MYRIQHIICCFVVFIVFPSIHEASDELNQLIHASEANITGKLVFHQMEGTLTFPRKNGVLAADLPTAVLFEYVPPWHTPQDARLTYNWDLGDGESVTARDPLVHYSYKVPGNYTLTLRVGASGKHSRVSGKFSKDIQVLDTIRSIKLNGPASYTVDQNISLTLVVGGSPPKWICWRIGTDCLPTHVTECSMVELHDSRLTLNLTFSSPGTHCLEISAHNDVSVLQTTYNIHVQTDPTGHLLFILPCIVLIMTILALITVSVSCPHYLRDFMRKTEVPANVSTYTCLEMKPTDNAPPPSQENESRPLLSDPVTRHSI